MKQRRTKHHVEPTNQPPLEWRVHTPNLLTEIGNNSSVGILSKPIVILMSLLHDVGTEAARINDPALNALMCRLTIYSCADPESPDYDPELTARVLSQKKQLQPNNLTKIKL